MNMELYEKYLTRSLSAEEAEQLRTLLAQDEKARREFVEYLQEWSLTADIAAQMSAYYQTATAEQPAPVSVKVRVKTKSSASFSPAGWLRELLERIFPPQRALAWGTACAVVLFVMGFFVFHAVRPQTIARVINTGPGAMVMCDGRSSPCAVGMRLAANTVIQTDARTSVLISFNDSTRVEMRPESKLTLQPPDQQGHVSKYRYGKKILLSGGTLTARIARQPPKHPMVFATPTIEACVLQTELAITAFPKAARLEVKQGRVDVSRAADLACLQVASGKYLLATEKNELKTRAIPKGAFGSVVRQNLLDDKAMLFFVPFDFSVGVEKSCHPLADNTGKLSGKGEYVPGIVKNGVSLPAGKLEAEKEQSIKYKLAGNMDMKKGTMMLWFKPYWQGTDRQGKYTLAWIRMQFPHSYANYFAWQRSFDPENPTLLYMTRDDFRYRHGNCIDTGEYFKKDKWIHLAMTWDRETSQAVIYANGNKVSSSSWQLSIPDEQVYLPVSLVLGKYDMDDPINGAYDELYLFGRALTADEISGYYYDTMLNAELEM